MNKLIKFFLIISIIVQFLYIINNKVKFHHKYLLNSLKEDYIGELNLPKETLEIKKIIKEEDIKVFNLSDKFKNDGLLYQRTIEFAYPSKFSKSSNIFFEIIDEINLGCELLLKNNYTQISKCILK